MTFINFNRKTSISILLLTMVFLPAAPYFDVVDSWGSGREIEHHAIEQNRKQWKVWKEGEFQPVSLRNIFTSDEEQFFGLWNPTLIDKRFLTPEVEGLLKARDYLLYLVQYLRQAFASELSITLDDKNLTSSGKDLYTLLFATFASQDTAVKKSGLNAKYMSDVSRILEGIAARMSLISNRYEEFLREQLALIDSRKGAEGLSLLVNDTIRFIIELDGQAYLALNTYGGYEKLDETIISDEKMEEIRNFDPPNNEVINETINVTVKNLFNASRNALVKASDDIQKIRGLSGWSRYRNVLGIGTILGLSAGAYLWFKRRANGSSE